MVKKRDRNRDSDFSKVSANEKVSMDVIERICVALDCQPGDIMEFVSVE
ncbi:helix-turn-helix domain-containing protein [Enterococcus sp. AZ192]